MKILQEGSIRIEDGRLYIEDFAYTDGSFADFESYILQSVERAMVDFRARRAADELSARFHRISQRPKGDA